MNEHRPAGTQSTLPAAANPLRFGDFIQGMLPSISQVFVKRNGLSAVLLIVGLALNSVAAVVTAHLLGAESELITGGLLGFSPVLTAIALGTMFYKPGSRVFAYALVGTVFTVLAQGAMNVVLTPFWLSTLTGPFVVSIWFFLLPRLQLM